MEDFDVFTDEIKFTKPLYKNILNKYVHEIPSSPSGPNYQSGRKLMAEECLEAGDDASCAFHLSESVSASLRIMAVYRDEQLKASANKLEKIKTFIKPVKDILDANPISKEEEKLFDFLSTNDDELMKTLESVKIEEEPFHKRYMRFGPDNNVDNLCRILKELPKEWTVVQLTAPYNPNENLKPLNEFRTEINSLYLTVLTNDYLDGTGPFTINIPANVNKEGEKPLFTELYSLLDENYETIANAQFLNNKRLVQNYWSRREDIDLRMKSVINVMDKEWLGGWGSLLTGRLIETGLRERIIKLVDTTISDWGFIRLTLKQKILLYNLIESCPVLNSHQTKSCIRRILTEHGNTEDVRLVLNKTDCQTCNKEFRFLNELCLKCLSKAFETIHHFSLVDGIRAFSQAATLVKDGDEWTALKKAERYPVILIVDEILDSFPWETLPILNHHPVCRMENIHFIYNLFKLHEKEFVNGYFEAGAEVGRYVINPEKNLERMEKRMCSFVQYWCGEWTGHVAEPPSPEDYLRHLTQADIFLYCGHGDGCHLASGGSGGGVEAVRARALCLLAGCGSVRLQRASPRAPPAAPHHHLHVAASPMVVGMLWEVTDLEVDKMVSSLVALYVPSSATPAWPSVGKGKWSQGILDTNVEDKSLFVPERDLLRAMARARGSTSYVMIASSMVARGLPIRISQRK
ncbi:extra spindle pole bodies like 1, separase [Aphomia sociella]